MCDGGTVVSAEAVARYERELDSLPPGCLLLVHRESRGGEEVYRVKFYPSREAAYAGCPALRKRMDRSAKLSEET